MLDQAEDRFVDGVSAFIRSDANFRSVTFEDQGILLADLDMRRTFMSVKGSYKSRDVLIGLQQNYDISSPERTRSSNSLFFKILCDSPVEATFTTERAEDITIKKVGLNAEVEVGIKDIDDRYLIHARDAAAAGMLTEIEKLKSFLIDSRERLEKLHVSNRYIEVRLSFNGGVEEPFSIREDLEIITEIAESLRH